MTCPAHPLLDTLIKNHGIKNDAQLARELDLLPPQVSKLRNGHQRVGASVILRVHEKYGMPVKDIRALLQTQSA